jgi:enamine deaminase RidA (YjgF/YER057c/UK114 family)
MSVADRLKSLGLTLPKYSAPHNNLVRMKQSGKLLFVSGHGPNKEDGSLLYQGRVGAELTVEQGQECARQAALNILGTIGHFGKLDQVAGVVKMLGFVNVTPDFSGAGNVINTASDLFTDVWGEDGVHARSAVGVGHLGQQPLTIEVIMEMK